jgi:glycosyltransferase involved in cell wall biosynthesis
VVRGLLRSGDTFLCASERQRDFWLGWLDAAGRVNPYTHGADPGLNSLIRVVPFGLPSVPPQPGPPRFRGVMPGIGADDFLVLWGGGIWDWFDPLTLVRAVGQAADRLPNLRLVFPTPDSPSEAVPRMKMAQSARELSDSLGLTGSHVFFGRSWVPYEERGAMLLEADLGVSVHLDSVENRFSFRTRVLDYLWAGLPVLTTEGDSMADLVRAEDLGAVVGYGDVDGLAEALVTLSSDPERRRECAERSAVAARRFHWAIAAESLLEYCRAPQQAPDREQMRALDLNSPSDDDLDPRRRGPAEVGRLITRTAQTIRREGPAGFLERGRGYLRRRARRAAAGR